MRIEPIFHTGSLLFSINDPPAAEVINDCGGLIGDFWRTMREEASFGRFLRLCHSTPFCEDAYQEALARIHDSDPVRRAWAFFTTNRQSALGNSKRFEYLSKQRTRRFMTEQASGFLSVVDRLPQFHERLKPVTYLSGKNPLDIIRQFDKPETLFVLTPKVSDKSFGSLHEFFPSQDKSYGYEVHNLIRNLVGHMLIVLESGQPMEQELKAMSWHKLDFETRNWTSWARTPPKPARLWANFSLANGFDSKRTSSKSRFML